MKNTLIKIGAVLVLLFGIVLTLIFVAFAVYVLAYYVDANSQKKIAVAVAAIIAAVLTLLVTIAIFEAMIELTHVEEQLEEIEEKKPEVVKKENEQDIKSLKEKTK